MQQKTQTVPNKTNSEIDASARQGLQSTLRNGGEVEITSTIEMRPGDSARRTKCNANTGTVYMQMYRSVQVEVTLSHCYCHRASDAYQIRLFTRNEAGEQDVRDFDETWQSSGQDRDTIKVFYDMGDYPDLVHAQVRRLSCTCSDNSENTIPSNTDQN